MTRRDPSPSSARTITLRVAFDDELDADAGLPEGTSERHRDPEAPPDPPRDVAGTPVLRDRDTLRALMAREAAWMRAQLPPDLAPGDDLPVADLDAWWGAHPDVEAAMMAVRAVDEDRGIIRVWPEELGCLRAEDLPHGVGVRVEADAEGTRSDLVLLRGVGPWPLAIECDLGAPRLGWTRTLDVTAYTQLIHAAAELRAARRGDLDVAYDASRAAGPFGVLLRVRLRCRTTSATEAFQTADALVAELRAPADVAEQRARRAVADLLEILHA